MLHTATERERLFDHHWLAHRKLLQALHRFRGQLGIRIDVDAEEIELGCDFFRQKTGKKFPLPGPRQRPDGDERVRIALADGGTQPPDPGDGNILPFSPGWIEGDVLQEVFLKIWRHRDTYDETKGRLFTWMLNIARNTAIDILRSKSHKLEEKIQNLTDDVHGINGPLTVQPSTDYLGFSRVLEKLTKEQRTLIDLAYYKGCTQEEISRVMEIPLGTVKTRMRNAIIQLRKIINK